jgi:hypothetical protein
MCGIWAVYLEGANLQLLTIEHAEQNSSRVTRQERAVGRELNGFTPH